MPELAIQPLTFSSLRSDWYAANSVMPRAVRHTLAGRKRYCFVGFPRQWIPVFTWFGVPWRDTIAPQRHIPFFSDLGEEQLVAVVERSRREGSLRNLVESASMYDSILSDFLYIADHTAEVDSEQMALERAEIARFSPRRRLLLNGWQSYGRPSVRELERRALAIEAPSSTAVALPCSLTRPYEKSKTHRKIYRLLQEQGYSVDRLHRVVITSLGVIPEELWSQPTVLVYDAGVPDIYRTLRLVRAFFGKARYRSVLDCLHFQPYVDCLRIAQREGLIRELVPVPQRRSRQFYIRP